MIGEDLGPIDRSVARVTEVTEFNIRSDQISEKQFSKSTAHLKKRASVEEKTKHYVYPRIFPAKHVQKEPNLMP